MKPPPINLSWLGALFFGRSTTRQCRLAQLEFRTRPEPKLRHERESQTYSCRLNSAGNVLVPRFVGTYGAYKLIAMANTTATIPNPIRTLRRSATISAPVFAEAGPQRRFPFAGRQFQRGDELAASCFLRAGEFSIIKKLHKERFGDPMRVSSHYPKVDMCRPAKN